MGCIRILRSIKQNESIVKWIQTKVLSIYMYSLMYLFLSGSVTYLFIRLLGIDIKTVSLIGSTLAASNTAQGIVNNGPKFVLCSSAGVTRPFWSEKKKSALG